MFSNKVLLVPLLLPLLDDLADLADDGAADTEGAAVVGEAVGAHVLVELPLPLPDLQPILYFFFFPSFRSNRSAIKRVSSPCAAPVLGRRSAWACSPRRDNTSRKPNGRREAFIFLARRGLGQNESGTLGSIYENGMRERAHLYLVLLCSVFLISGLVCGPMVGLEMRVRGIQAECRVLALVRALA